MDAVVGQGRVTAKHLAKMRYLKACLDESLRLTPTTVGTSRVLEVGHGLELDFSVEGAQSIDFLLSVCLTSS